jgi:hypothetical protein
LVPLARCAADVAARWCAIRIKCAPVTHARATHNAMSAGAFQRDTDAWPSEVSMLFFEITSPGTFLEAFLPAVFGAMIGGGFVLLALFLQQRAQELR